MPEDPAPDKTPSGRGRRGQHQCRAPDLRQTPGAQRERQDRGTDFQGEDGPVVVDPDGNPVERHGLGPEGFAGGRELASQGRLAAQNQEQGDELLQVDGRQRKLDRAVTLRLHPQHDRAAIGRNIPGDIGNLKRWLPPGPVARIVGPPGRLTRHGKSQGGGSPSSRRRRSLPYHRSISLPT